MFKVASNIQIGKYLEKKINKKYPSRRQFAKAFIELRDGESDNKTIDDRAKLLGLVTKGERSIQLDDLPIYCELLDISVETLITAGKSIKHSYNHMTNYYVANSTDPKVWEQYATDKAGTIANYDEYNMSVLDYALDNDNYPFIQFLIDKGYITLIGDDYNKKYSPSFGADTVFLSNYVHDSTLNGLKRELNYSDDWRKLLINLMIEHKDIKNLEVIRGRETIDLYKYCTYWRCEGFTPASEDFIESIVNSSEEIIRYFTEPFEYINCRDEKNTVLYLSVNHLLDQLIVKNVPFIQDILIKSISHNKTVLSKINRYLNDLLDYDKKQYSFIPDYVPKIRNNYIDQYNNVLIYHGVYEKHTTIDMFYQINTQSNDAMTNYLIDQLNEVTNELLTKIKCE